VTNKEIYNIAAFSNALDRFDHDLSTVNPVFDGLPLPLFGKLSLPENKGIAGDLADRIDSCRRRMAVLSRAMERASKKFRLAESLANKKKRS